MQGPTWMLRRSLASTSHACSQPPPPLQGDFGLTMSMRQESAISPVGTVEYMAPEVRGVQLGLGTGLTGLVGAIAAMSYPS